MLLPITLLTALLFVVFPNVVIQPFTTQNATALQISLFLLRYQKPVELICAAVALLSLIPRRRSAWRITGVAVVVLCAVFSRIDIYERLFHPIGQPSFQTIGETHLDPDEHLLAVGDRAYPIREISYHHVVNGFDGAVPIAVTY